MLIFDYKCKKCGKVFESLVPKYCTPVFCRCGGDGMKQVSAANVVFSPDFEAVPRIKK
jgi:putative FmdB family regulatory protein